MPETPHAAAIALLTSHLNEAGSVVWRLESESLKPGVKNIQHLRAAERRVAALHYAIAILEGRTATI